MADDSSKNARRWASLYKQAIGLVVLMIATAAFILAIDWLVWLGNEVIGIVF